MNRRAEEARAGGGRKSSAHGHKTMGRESMNSTNRHMRAFRAFLGLIVSIVLLAAGLVLTYRFFGLHIGRGSFTNNLLQGKLTIDNLAGVAGLFACLLLIGIGTGGIGAWRYVLRVCREYRESPYGEYKCTDYPGRDLNQLCTEYRYNLGTGDTMAAVGIARTLCEYTVRIFEENAQMTASDEDVMADRIKRVCATYRLGRDVTDAMLEIWDISSDCLHGRIPEKWEVESVCDDVKTLLGVFSDGPGKAFETRRYDSQQRRIRLQSKRESIVGPAMWVVIPGVPYLMLLVIGRLLYYLSAAQWGGM